MSICTALRTAWIIILPCAEGDTIEWLELFRMLYAVGYAGLINFESKGEPKHLDTIEATALAPERIVALEAGT